MTVHARCPECDKTLASVEGHFPEHSTWLDDLRVICTGSGWIVEDEDIVPGRWPRG